MPKKTFGNAKTTETDLTVSVKGNQKELLADVKASFAIFPAPELTVVTKEKGRPVEKRYRTLPANRRTMLGNPEWRALLAGIVEVTRTRFDKTKTETETQYYVSTRFLSPAEAEATVRGHWHVEGRFHQQLDRCLGEDAARRSGFAEVAGLLNAIVHNLLRRNFEGEWSREMFRNAMNGRRLATLKGFFK